MSSRIKTMAAPLSTKVTLNDLRAVRTGNRPKLAMLTCYDFTTARLMERAGVPALLVGDSAANVILGHPTTLPVPLSFMMEITAAVRRGAPNVLLMADMPFGSYHGSLDRGVRNVIRMVQRTGCDCVKLEVADGHSPLIEALAEAGVAVVAHIGLRPQSVGVLGGYRFQGRTAEEADNIVALARRLATAGATALLLEAVPPEVGQAVVDAVKVPVIGCGAGPACHGFVFVTHDAIGLSDHVPRFVPQLGDVAGPNIEAFSQYVDQVVAGSYPATDHNYTMPPAEKAKFLQPRRSDEPVQTYD